MGYACTHDVPAVDDTMTINGQEVMRVKDVARLARCSTTSVYRAIDYGALTLLYRGLVEARSARNFIARWSDTTGPGGRARKKPRTVTPAAGTLLTTLNLTTDESAH